MANPGEGGGARREEGAGRTANPWKGRGGRRGGQAILGKGADGGGAIRGRPRFQRQGLLALALAGRLVQLSRASFLELEGPGRIMASLRTLLDLVLSGQRSGQRSFLGDSPGEAFAVMSPQLSTWATALGHTAPKMRSCPFPCHIFIHI